MGLAGVLSKLGAAIRRAPPLAWWLLAGLILVPWYLRYLLEVVGQGCGFALPVR